MNAQPEVREGDEVLVKAKVRGGTVVYGSGHIDLLSAIEIASIEKINFRVGDRVIAEGHHGVILCIRRNVAWVEPDAGNHRPWTVDLMFCRREPAPKSSAEILPFQESAPERPCDSEDTAA